MHANLKYLTSSQTIYYDFNALNYFRKSGQKMGRKMTFFILNYQRKFMHINHYRDGKGGAVKTFIFTF